MYESIWGLRNRPFSPTPEVARYFPADVIEEARQTLVRGIERAEGPGLLIGPAGSGKTLLCQLLALHFRAQYSVAMLSSTRIRSTRDLLRAILFELGLPYRRRDEGELRLALIGFLSRSEKCPNGMLLVVDEAHSLNLRVLEELRMLSNLVRSGQPRVRLVLAGGPALEERFTHPKLDSFNQRLAARCYLRAWDRAETSQFMHSQLATAGGDCEEIFSPDAIDQIYNATEGIPRLVVQLCDHTMTLAAAGGQRQIDAAGIQEAWSDLQQLPAPWNESSSMARSGAEDADDVIEFGQLDEDAPQQESQPAAVASDSAWDAPIEEPGPHLADTETIDETMDRVTATFGELDEACEAESLQAEESLNEMPQAAEAIGLKLVNEASDGDVSDDDFEDEEVIVDHYATLDSIIGCSVVAPLDPEARELSDYFADERLLHQVSDSASEPEIIAEEIGESHHSSPDPYAELESDPEQARIVGNPSADPVMPEMQSLDTIALLRDEPVSASATTDFAANDSHAAEMPPTRSAAHDEIPLIVIEDDIPQATNPGGDEPIAQRQEYGQLFARLLDS